MSRYRKLLLALGAVASLYLVRATGLDAGLIDAVLQAAVDAFAPAPEAVPVPVVVEPVQ